MGFSFLPKEIMFFDLFDKLSEMAVTAANYFKEIVEKGDFDDESLLRMREHENLCDNTTHEILNKLNKTFITPFDREDIHSLAHELDSIVDIILTITNRMKIYKMCGQVDQHLIKFSDVIYRAVIEISKAVNALRELKKPDLIQQYCIEVKRLENVGDQIRDNAMGELFNNNDPVHIMKWKEIYEHAEHVIDQCEDVANIVSTIVVKQA
jgi:predicted phosphate transport protein (TIGR00153 family)